MQRTAAHLPPSRSPCERTLLGGRSQHANSLNEGSGRSGGPTIDGTINQRARPSTLIESHQFKDQKFFRLPSLYILRTGLGQFAACSVSAHKGTSQPAGRPRDPRQVRFAASRGPRTVRRGGDSRRKSRAEIETSPPPLPPPLPPRRRRAPRARRRHATPLCRRRPSATPSPTPSLSPASVGSLRQPPTPDAPPTVT